MRALLMERDKIIKVVCITWLRYMGDSGLWCARGELVMWQQGVTWWFEWKVDMMCVGVSWKVAGLQCWIMRCFWAKGWLNLVIWQVPESQWVLRYNENGMFVSCGVKLLRRVWQEVDGVLCVSVECTSKVIYFDRFDWQWYLAK